MVPAEPSKLWLLVGVARGACKAGAPAIGAGSGASKASGPATGARSVWPGTSAMLCGFSLL
eukprot:11218360-Lingulodinium_polyedra.AAC.1